MDSACKSRHRSRRLRTSVWLDRLVGPFAPVSWVDRNDAIDADACPTGIGAAYRECERVIASAIEHGDLDLALGWNRCNRLPWGCGGAFHRSSADVRLGTSYR